MENSTGTGTGSGDGDRSSVAVRERPWWRLDRSTLIALAALAALALLIGYVVVDSVLPENRLVDARVAEPCSYSSDGDGVAVSVVVEVSSDNVDEGIVRVEVVDGAGEIVVTGSRQFETAGTGEEWHGFDFVIPLPRSQWNDAMTCQIGYASL
jgi:hypothetical protein